MNDVRHYIAEKIRELRTAEQLTQTDLAKRLGTTPNTVSRWESGVYKPRIEDLEAIARAFERPIRVFFPQELQPANELQRLLLSKTGTLPPQDIEEVIRFAEFVRMKKNLDTGVQKVRKGKGDGSPKDL